MTYLFKYEPHKRYLFFVDSRGHKSGTAMKNLALVRPEIVDKLQKILVEFDATVGDIVNVERYTFIVVRKHYRNKTDLAATSRALDKLSKETYKTTNEDFPEIIKLCQEYPHIQIYTSSDFYENMSKPQS